MARLSSISFFGIRNLKHQSVDVESDVVVITGDNRQGKTNFLEAAYFGLSGRSFRTSRLKEIITYGKNAGWVEVELSDGTFLKSVLSVQEEEKTSVSFFINDRKVPLRENPYRMRVFPVLGSDIVELHRKSILTKKVLQFALRFDEKLREFYSTYASLRRKRRKILRDGGDRSLLVVIDSKISKVVIPLNNHLKRLALKLNKLLTNRVIRIIPGVESVISYISFDEPVRIGYFRWDIDRSLLTLGTKMLLLMYLLEGLVDIYQARDRMYIFWDDVGFELDKLTLRMLIQRLALRFQIFWAIPWLPEDVLPTTAESKVFKIHDGELVVL